MSSSIVPVTSGFFHTASGIQCLLLLILLQYSPEASTECLTCPAGKICSDPALPPVTCSVSVESFNFCFDSQGYLFAELHVQKGKFSLQLLQILTQMTILIFFPRLELTVMALTVFHVMLAIIVHLLQMFLNPVLMVPTLMKQEQLAAKCVMPDIPA